MSKVTVIIPTYNRADKIEKSIKSVLDQTYEDFRLILVDDGGSDECGIECEKYISLDPRVIVIHQPNGGLSAARNVGYSIAKYDNIVFLDSDIVLSKNYIYDMNIRILKI